MKPIIFIKQVNGLLISKRVPRRHGQRPYIISDGLEGVIVGEFNNLRNAERFADGHKKDMLAGMLPSKARFMIPIMMAFFIFSGIARAAVPIDGDKAVRAIVGEAEGEPYAGKLAVAHALRNRAKIAYYGRRGVFVGVYGLQREIKAPERVWREAREAWEASAWVDDSTSGASVWGTDSDVRKFEKQKWFKNCRFMKRIGAHNFFKEVV